MNYHILLFIFVALFARGTFPGLPEKNHESTSVLDFTLKSIDGQDIDLKSLSRQGHIDLLMSPVNAVLHHSIKSFKLYMKNIQKKDLRF